jgi:hypothetical protein
VCCWGNLKEGDHLEDPGEGGNTVSRVTFRKWVVGAWTGSSWLSIGTSDGHALTQY